MRTRDEVLIGSYRYTLRENGWTMTHVDHDNKTPVTWPHTVEMIDRIRELEAQQAASEPVAWALYRGETPLMACLSEPKDSEKRAARVSGDGWRPLYAHPSAAAVTVTEAMVEAAAKVGCDNGFDRDFDAPGMYWDAMHKVVTAALDAASEGASA